MDGGAAVCAESVALPVTSTEPSLRTRGVQIR